MKYNWFFSKSNTTILFYAAVFRSTPVHNVLNVIEYSNAEPLKILDIFQHV